MRIFLSYRRGDSSAWSGRLRDVLAARVGEENVFQDVSAVRPGQDFTSAIDGALGRSNVVLVVIGPTWLTAASADGLRHLSDEHDHVRGELRAALRLGGLIVPVLVGRATMPRPEQLPDDLRALSMLQAVTLNDDTWRRDVEGLLEAIGVATRPARRRRWAIAAVAVGALVVGAAIVVNLLADDADGSSADNPSTTVGSSGPSTTLDALSQIAECTGVSASDEWHEFTPSGDALVGSADVPSATVTVVDGRYRSGDGGRWDVVLQIDYAVSEGREQYQYWWIYGLAAAGQSFDPSCFSVTGGQEPSCCGRASEVLVGFDLPADPSEGAALLLENINATGRIDLAPS
ncbi:MAG: toll/interleukin-1 receptor domain-containing protein [Ilumatobacteraceae bacterium]